jgi:hypothetical protein
MIPGGYQNSATNVSFAAGRRAAAVHEGSFVWADSGFTTFSTTDTNQFLVQASGGVGINTNNPQATLHVNGEAIIGSTGNPATIGMHLVRAELSDTLFTHPFQPIVMSWNSVDKILSVSNSTPSYIQVSLSYTGVDLTESFRFLRDINEGATASITNQWSVAAGFNVTVASDSFSSGYTFDATSFENTIQGLVTYWQ